jgi:hypothetical protein
MLLWCGEREMDYLDVFCAGNEGYRCVEQLRTWYAQHPRWVCVVNGSTIKLNMKRMREEYSEHRMESWEKDFKQRGYYVSKYVTSRNAWKSFSRKSPVVTTMKKKRQRSDAEEDDATASPNKPMEEVFVGEDDEKIHRVFNDYFFDIVDQLNGV